jgi:hypothetical protein
MHPLPRYAPPRHASPRNEPPLYAVLRYAAPRYAAPHNAASRYAAPRAYCVVMSNPHKVDFPLKVLIGVVEMRIWPFDHLCTSQMGFATKMGLTV